jgi:hypothetical protein
MAKLRIVSVRHVAVADDRHVTVYADDELRGPVEIHLGEDEARWLWASLDMPVKAWRREDGEGD